MLILCTGCLPNIPNAAWRVCTPLPQSTNLHARDTQVPLHKKSSLMASSFSYFSQFSCFWSVNSTKLQKGYHNAYAIHTFKSMVRNFVHLGRAFTLTHKDVLVIWQTRVANIRLFFEHFHIARTYILEAYVTIKVYCDKVDT